MKEIKQIIEVRDDNDTTKEMIDWDGNFIMKYCIISEDTMRKITFSTNWDKVSSLSSVK